MRKGEAYTVFGPDGEPKVSRLGLVVFVRTLAQARAAMDPGDTVQQWSSSGGPLARRRMTERGTLERVS